MTATNHTGWEVQVFVDRRIGWVTEMIGADTFEEAQKICAAMNEQIHDGKERRAYESLEGY